jgi:hypothetical protein
MGNPFSDPDVVIVSYTRAQAIEDGVLVDVSEWASTREMMGGFTIPVALTSAVWALVQAPEGSHEDTRGRAHDVLWLASCAARSSRTHFTVRLGNRDIRMWLHAGPGDDAEPVATIMLEGED